MGQKYSVKNNSHTSEPDEFVILLIRITGKNGRQTYTIKTDMLLTLPHLYYYNNLLYVIKIVFIAILN
jgi:hypothetical protein